MIKVSRAKKMFRLWEVVSVVQTLSLDEQLRILDKLDIDSFQYHLPEFRDNFTKSDVELAQTALRSGKFWNHLSVDDFRKVTRLSILYALSTPTQHTLGHQVRRELTEYFATLDFHILVAFREMLMKSTFTDALDGPVADGIVDRNAYGHTSLLGFYIKDEVFRSALKKGRDDVANYLLSDVINNADNLVQFVQVVLELANTDYFDRVVNDYLTKYMQKTRETELVVRKHLLDSIQSGNFPPDDDDNRRKRARMLLKIGNGLGLDSFRKVLLTIRIKHFAAFVVESIDRFDWLPVTGLSLVKQQMILTILNDQV